MAVVRSVEPEYEDDDIVAVAEGSEAAGEIAFFVEGEDKDGEHGSTSGGDCRIEIRQPAGGAGQENSAWAQWAPAWPRSCQALG